MNGTGTYLERPEPLVLRGGDDYLTMQLEILQRDSQNYRGLPQQRADMRETFDEIGRTVKGKLSVLGMLSSYSPRPQVRTRRFIGQRPPSTEYQPVFEAYAQPSADLNVVWQVLKSTIADDNSLDSVVDGLRAR